MYMGRQKGEGVVEEDGINMDKNNNGLHSKKKT